MKMLFKSPMIYAQQINRYFL